ncbi:MAG: (d)CMP kinase [Candidatus Delongbacteria bacterium]|jgi:cytidylate kinase|nr:(d)CMP kinase [Candidatus Delongbacteria bacterium]
MEKKTFVIAIDGHSSCGKSTLARQLAEKLDIVYVDSGAMYRALTWYAQQHRCFDEKDTLNRQKLIQTLPDINIDFIKKNNEHHTMLNNQDVSGLIRSMEISKLVSEVSAVPKVRQKMVKLQRKMAQNKSLVMDGRDIGTVVFPDADLKIFLTAKEQIRAKRRFKELREQGIKTDFEAVLENIKKRDRIDSTREVSPLKKAGDACVIDNSELTPEEQLAKALQLVKKKCHEN